MVSIILLVQYWTTGWSNNSKAPIQDKVVEKTVEFQYLSITYEYSNNKNNKPFLFVPSLYNIYNKFITQLQPGFYPVSKALYHATINHQFYLFIVMTAVNLRTKTFFHGLSSYQHNISSVTLILVDQIPRENCLPTAVVSPCTLRLQRTWLWGLGNNTKEI